MPITIEVKHRADSALRKFRVLCKLNLGGQVRSSEMPYVSCLVVATPVPVACVVIRYIQQLLRHASTKTTEIYHMLV